MSILLSPKKVRQAPRVCVQCSKDFVCGSASGKYCSEACAREYIGNNYVCKKHGKLAFTDVEFKGANARTGAACRMCSHLKKKIAHIQNRREVVTACRGCGVEFCRVRKHYLFCMPECHLDYIRRNPVCPDHGPLLDGEFYAIMRKNSVANLVCRKCQRKWRESPKGKQAMIEITNQYRANNPEKVKENAKRYGKISTKKMVDGATLPYVKKMMVYGSNLKAKDIPDDLASLKRTTLLIKRKIKELKNDNT